ncbi:MAG TPA: DUF2169 domain-containing protein [Blastocatellia bacterium]|jgi:hypothetical protein|nr:DUF2169 domain-containing protein [Blastocatellia bacterium]
MEANKPEFDVVSGQTEAGTPIFSVLVKRTYDIRPNQPAVRAAQTRPLVKVDEYYDHGDPERSPVKYETDLSPYKLATDVVLVGKAYAPAGNPTSQMAVTLQVADYRKVIQVIGDRRLIYQNNRHPSFTDPVEFTDMEIRYDRAYGGTYMRSDPSRMFPYPRNPIGAGFAIGNTREAIDGLPAPNLEDPGDLLQPHRVALEAPEQWNRQPLPQGSGWFQRNWYPRCSFVGAVPGFVDPDEVMREEELGIVPKNQIALARQFKLPAFDVRFNNGASPGLALPFLTGGEPVKLINLTPAGLLDFFLPNDSPRIMLDIGLGENELKPALHTVCIRPDEMQVDLVWRGAHEYPGIDWLAEMKRLVAQIS